MRTSRRRTGDDAYRLLALYVVRQAVLDAVSTDTACRRDADAFLDRELWSPSCLWFRLLEDCLHKPRLRAVVQRLRAVPLRTRRAWARAAGHDTLISAS